MSNSDTIEFYSLRDAINNLFYRLDQESMANHMGTLQYPLSNLNYMNTDIVTRLRNKISENINSDDASLQAHISIARQFIEDIALIVLRMGLDITFLTNANLMNMFQERLNQNIIKDDITEIINKNDGIIMLNNAKNLSLM